MWAMDMTRITSRLYQRHTSTPGNMLNSTQQDPYYGIIPWHQKQFKECLDEFQREDEEILTDEIKNLQFYDWQRKAELALLSQHNKQILWIYMYDQERGKGKSTLDEYLNEDIMLLFSSTDRQQI